MRRVACIALPEIRVEIVRERNSVRAALERVAEAALAFGPAAAFDVAQDVVWVEIGGCAHLHGSERELAQALDARVRALGHACRVAVADGPRIAAAVARFALDGTTPLVVPEEKGAAAMRFLPVAALGLEDDVTAWLTDLGLRTCGDLQKLPRRALGTRLGARAHDVMQLLGGEDRSPLDVWRPPEVPEERVELEWGAGSVEALAFVTKTLCDRLAVRLNGRAMAAARLELVLGLDRALCEGSSPTSVLDVSLPMPIARAEDLLAVVRARLERHSLAAPVLTAMLRAIELARVSGRPLNLLAPEPKADVALPRLVSELAADLGDASIGTLGLVDTWAPDERTRLVPFGQPAAVPRHALLTSTIEPSRLVRPRRVPRESLADAELLARMESTEWWRQGILRRRESVRDLFMLWVAEQQGLAWVELVSPDDEAWLRGWMD
jgi:protein ImuB